MSTRAYICLKEKDGSYNGIYNHRDGYPSFLGYYLKTYYNSEERVRKLMEGGNLSGIGSMIEAPEGEQHDFETPYRKGDESVCVYYGRDRGEEGQEMQNYVVERESQLIKAFNVCGAEWVYLWKNNKWYVAEAHCRFDEKTQEFKKWLGKFVPLTDEIIERDD